MMTMPFKNKVFIADSFVLLVIAFISIFQFIVILPFVLYTAYVLALEKEQGF